jgi:hypothetical protein
MRDQREMQDEDVLKRRGVYVEVRNEIKKNAKVTSVIQV